MGAQHGGSRCTGSSTTTQSCNTDACPVDCTWSDWTWSNCSKTCGNGTQNGTRTISQAAQHGGSSCTGSSTSTQSCNTDACPGLRGECYKDTSSRLLKHYKSLGQQNTPDNCQQYCAGQDFIYSGVQAKTQCFCGNDK